MSAFNKRTTALLLAVLLLVSLGGMAFAEETEDRSRTVVGADLTDDQINEVYEHFGVERGSVKELLLTNAEERALLEGLVADEKLGKYSISCVYVQMMSEGSGLEVETYNINYCTTEMYANALRTAGIRDVRLIVASPFEASGTAALAGVYKAYESITGVKLDPAAKLAGARELTTTGELAEEIGTPDAEKIISGLKDIITDSAPKEEQKEQGSSKRDRIAELAEKYNIQLSEKQISQLEDLGNTLENINIEEQVEQAKDAIEHISEKKDQAVDLFKKVKGLFSAASDFFDKFKELVSN